MMNLISIIAITLSIVNFYFLLKKRSEKPFQRDLEEFKIETQSLMTEFNRVAARNISLLDEKIEELDYKIRLSKKIDIVLKERLEEMNQISYLQNLELDKLDKKISTNKKEKNNKSVTKKEKQVISETINLEKNKENKIADDLNKEITKESEYILFDGVSVEKIEKYSLQKLPIHKKQQLLIDYILENKTKEELLQIGFSLNEINLAQLSLSITEK